MLARPRQCGQLAMHRIFLHAPWRGVGGVERKSRRSAERRTHHHDRSEHVGPHQRTPCGDRTGEIMSDHGIDAAIAER